MAEEKNNAVLEHKAGMDTSEYELNMKPVSSHHEEQQQAAEAVNGSEWGSGWVQGREAARGWRLWPHRKH